MGDGDAPDGRERDGHEGDGHEGDGRAARRLAVVTGPAAASDALGTLRAHLAGAAPAVDLVACPAPEAAPAGVAAVLVPVRLPLAHLCAALQAGAAPEAALADWRDRTEALLRGCGMAEAPVLMVDADLLRAQPAACAAALAARLKLRLVPTDPAADRSLAARTLSCGPRVALHRSDTGDVGIPVPSEGDPEQDAPPACCPIRAALAAGLLAGDAAAGALAAAMAPMLIVGTAPHAPTPARTADALRSLAALTEERDLLREALERALAGTEQGLCDRAERYLVAAQAGALERQLAAAQAEGRMQARTLGGALLDQVAQRRARAAEAQTARDDLARLRAAVWWRRLLRPVRALGRRLTRS